MVTWLAVQGKSISNSQEYEVRGVKKREVVTWLAVQGKSISYSQECEVRG